MRGAAALVMSRETSDNSFTNDVIGLGEGGGFQIITADNGGRVFLPKMTSSFTAIFGLIFWIKVNHKSEFQKYINHKFS